MSRKKYTAKELINLDPNSEQAKELLKTSLEFVDHSITRSSNLLRYLISFLMLGLGFVSAHYYPGVSIGYNDITLTGLFSGGGVIMLTYQFIRDGVEFAVQVYKQIKS